MAEPKWIIERLSRQHDRNGFDCGVPSLDDFLKTRANQFEKRDLGRTFVAVAPHDLKNVLGYYTLASGAVNFDTIPAEEKTGLPTRMPISVLHLGRLAVSKVAQGLGLGSFLLIDALWRGFIHGSSIAMRAVEVFAINDDARRFYLKYGFVELVDDRMHLYLSMKKVAKLLPGEYAG